MRHAPARVREGIFLPVVGGIIAGLAVCLIVAAIIGVSNG
jgi:hypothetical protein